MDANTAQRRGEMGLSIFFQGNDGGRPGGGGDIHPPPQKHYSPIYCDSSGIGDVYGGVAVTGRAGVKDMVGSGMIGLGGRAGKREGDRGRESDVRVVICRRDKGISRKY